MRRLFAASIGNALEWYDWTVFGLFSIYFAGQFFPPGHEELAFINTFAAYALAFFFRPVGGVVIGRFSDIKGRRPALLLTIVLMAAGSAGIGLLPTYEQIGWFAPILLLLARIAQGIAVGGEVSNASTYLSEMAPPTYRGRYASFFQSSTASAVLLASLTAYFLSQVFDSETMTAWGWRIPFLVGGVLGLIGIWLRRSLAETEVFEQKKSVAPRVRRPLLTTLRRHPRAVVQVFAVTMLSTLLYYTYFAALTPFATRTRGAAPEDVFLALSIATAMFVALQYPTAALSDRIGRKPVLLGSAAATALITVPLSTLVRPGLGNLMVAFVGGLAIYSFVTSILPALMSELFPTEVRGLGIGAWYNLTVALFGGTAPLLMSVFAAAGTPDVFFWYVTAGAVLAFLVILRLPETRGTELT
jgi:MHS family alpha-ketoglutarate permease-like MFS transporter